MMKYTAFVKTIAVDKQPIAANSTKVDTAVHDFYIEGNNTEETMLASLQERVLAVVHEENMEAQHIPFHSEYSLYAVGSQAKCTVKDLIQVDSDDILTECVKSSPAVDPHYEQMDLRCVTNKQVTKPSAWSAKRGPWLTHSELVDACTERGIPIPQSSSGATSLTVNELKDKLLPWYEGKIHHANTVFQLHIVVAVKNEGKQITKKRTGGPEMFSVEVLPPRVHRNPKDLSTCVMDTVENAGTIVTTLDLEFDGAKETDENFYTRFREVVVEKYKDKYPDREFEKEALFYLSRANSVGMIHVDNAPTLLVKLRSGSGPQKNHIKVAAGAQQAAPVPDGQDDYEIDDNGHYIHPVLPVKASTAAARLQKETEDNAKEAIKVLYFNPLSPLKYGFNKSHAIFLRAFLTQASSKSVIEGLLTKPTPKFPPFGYNGYLQATWAGQGWGSALLMKQTSSVPEKDMFPPTVGREDEIPEKIYPGNSSGGGGSGSGSGSGSGGLQTVGSGLHAVAEAMRNRGGSAAGEVNYIKEYGSLHNFFTLADLSVDNIAAIAQAEITTVEVLHELVNQAHLDKERNFTRAVQEYIPSFPLVASLKILAQSRKRPVAE